MQKLNRLMMKYILMGLLLGATAPLFALPAYLGSGASGWQIRGGFELSGQACETVLGSDLDGDGKREMLTMTTNPAADNLRLYECDGLTSLSTLVWHMTTGGTDNTSNYQLFRIANTGDSDGDGKKEILVGVSDTTPGTTDTIKIYEFNPALNGGQLGATNPTTSTPTTVLPIGNIAPTTNTNMNGVFVADLDQDGHPEVVALTQNGSRAIVIYESTGDGAYAAPITLAMPSGVCDYSQVADLDGDGKPEFAIVSINRQMSVINFDGTTINVETTVGTAGTNSSNANVEIGNLDNAGLPEIIYSDSTLRGVMIYEGVTTNTYTCDEPTGLWIDGAPLFTGVSTPPGTVGIIRYSTDSQARAAVLWGCQNSGTDGQAGEHEAFFIAEHTGAAGDFTQSAFASLQVFLNPPQEPVWIDSISTPGTLDGDDNVDLFFGTRSTSNTTTATANDGIADLTWVERVIALNAVKSWTVFE
jgi:hypothetical protein